MEWIKHKKPVCLAAAVAACLLTRGAIADSGNEQVCTTPYVDGIYRLIVMKENPPGQEQAWYQDYRYQYLVFHSTHTYDFVASRHPMYKFEDLQKAIVRAIAEGTTASNKKYTLDDTGLLNLYSNERVEYSYRCLVASKGFGIEQPGDIALTGYSRTNTLLTKIFRHWP